ncbi:MAG: type IIA DNA topoisomerase subunit B [Deltaproteobacteria bacterium]|nr:type IIA DNA topoisomerase subunit B [Deltaproteobacteria bacterium]MBW2547357.1 type IIA DNA topoisomerase subunit B [Deltaproteobacteria bacterium]MBW2719857.1 type IIA DNA topoisomerase subunit B [Deltaproteobacteria bacterium]
MAYTAKDIDVLEGLEPVRKRPAMYIGGTDAHGYHHLLWEILDNSVDEAINGHASRIEVELDADHRGATVTDNGRGIPVDTHPKFKKSALELILTTLHAGGKFEGTSYQVAGGLHGVGASVVNALSSDLTATVWRGGKTYSQPYKRGKASAKLKRGGKTSKRGTSIHFRPDADIFGKRAAFDSKRVVERLEAKSYLHRGLKIVFVDGKTGERQEFEHPGGIVDFLDKLVVERGKPSVHPEAFTADNDSEPRLEVALRWTEATDELIRSYANGIPTGSGGTHENGFKQGLSKAIRNHMDTHKLTPKGVKVTADDIREGLVALVSVYVEEPQFQGQTKDRLNNPEITAQIETSVRTAFEQWLLNNKTSAESIIARVIISSRARAASRAASQQVSRKTAISHRLNLPGKLADCSSTNPDDSELFLVEGDSAGGNAKQGRDRKTQAILPLRGKVLNAERATQAQILGNRELQDVVSALGCGIGKDFDISKLRYGRVFLLMDADSDGHHIATLLLTFFFRMLPGLVKAGHIFLAQPPLYRIDIGKEVHWALDDEERDRIIAGAASNAKVDISRFKGLGEMTAEELRETTLDKNRRRALRVVVEGELEADRVFSELMGKDPAARYRFIMEEAPQAEAVELDV